MRQAGATLHRGARASHYRGLSCCGAQAPERRLSSCGSRAQMLRGMWDLPRPGLEPVSPALAGRFSTAAPPGKPENEFFESRFLPTRGQGGRPLLPKRLSEPGRVTGCKGSVLDAWVPPLAVRPGGTLDFSGPQFPRP